MAEAAGEAPGRNPASLVGGRRTAVAGLRKLDPVLAPISVLVGAIVLVIAGALPVWGTRLIAPQYPKGLELWFYGGRVEGPLTEVNALNHYIGMRPIDLSVVPEMVLWPLAVVSAAAMLAVAVLWRGWLSRLALLGLWFIPVTVLADIQRWLIIFGSELNDASALRLQPFVPLVIGPTKVWNFTVWGYPGMALIGIWLVALSVTIIRRRSQPAARLRGPVAVTAVALSVIGAVGYVMPATREPPSSSGADPVQRQETRSVSDGRSLQAMIETAAPGSTVLVPAGTYYERIVVDRPMILLAEGEVSIDGGGRGTVVTIGAPDVTLRGFRVSSSGGQGEDGAGVKVLAVDNVSLEDLIVRDTFTGIAALGATNLRLSGNEVAGSGQATAGADHAMSGSTPAASPPDADAQASPNVADPHAAHGVGDGPQGQGDGISLWNVTGALLRNNSVHDVRDAVYLNYAADVLVDTNSITASRYGVHAMFGQTITVFGNQLERNLSGLVFMYSTDVLIGRNTIVDHRSAGTGFGVVTKDVVGLRLAENVIARNRVGFRAEGTAHQAGSKAEALRNRFSANNVGVSLMASSNIGFGANVFENNLTQVLALDRGIERRNQWTYQGTGNSWSDYRGYDLRNDGTGDVAHVSYGAAQLLLQASPALEMYVTAPAYEIYLRAQQMWAAGRQPMLIDQAPLTVDTAPPLDAGRAPGSPLGWWLAGGLLMLAGVLGHRGRAGHLRARHDRLRPGAADD